jgi:organic radical activating enzyme
MLAINEEFVSIQGEGYNVGVLQYFIRTQGCAVGCYFCDTKYTWKQSEAITKEEDIVKRVVDSGVEWACITGGEPLEQDITRLVEMLNHRGIKTQIETSGMYYSDIVKKIDWVCCSPKMLYSKKNFQDDILQYTDEVKCVVTNKKDLDFYLDYFKDYDGHKVFQPVAEDKTNMAQMIADRKIKDWRVQIQEHEVLGLR